MATELIINATLPETRIALLENKEIQELHIERDSEKGIVGNIYKGKVIRVLPGMQAAFVDIGLEKAAFLYVDDIFFPEMKTPLATNPLLEALPRTAIEQRREPVSPREGREGGRHGGRRGRGRQGRGGEYPAKPKGPIIPGSPEEHAQLQREYAKRMLELDSEIDAEETGGPATSDTAATTIPAPPVAAGASPEDLEVPEQPAARSPGLAEMDISDREEMELAAEEGEEIEKAEPSDVESQLVYRPEPIIDAEAWVEDVAKAHIEVSGEEQPAGGESTEAPEAQAAPAATVVEPEEEVDSELEAEVEASAAAPTSDEETTEEGQAPVVETQEQRPQPRGRRQAGGAANARGRAPVTPVAEEDDEDEEIGEMPRRRRRRESVNIADLVKEGQEILVQVAKDPIGTKGARLTCHVSLPGRYLVFMPTVDHIGVSRRIESEAERRRLKETISRIRPAKTGVIVRTASGKQTDKKLKADLDYLVTTWNDIQKKFNKQRTPSLVYQDLTIVLRAIRDMFTDEVDKVVVDSKREHKAIMKFVTRFIPHVKDKVDLYEGQLPIFDAYGIEPEIARSLERKVWLKSGGYLVVDQAEALVAIDVNTGRYVGKKTLEETILKTNLEAVKEIAYQLRLRNCGGIIILDLIDMEKDANKEKVYKALEEALKKDRARPTIMKISQLGLIEMTRKRTRDSLVRSLCEPCSYCEGKGFVKNKLTIAYDIMRDIEREGQDKDTSAISIQCHPTVADVILEDKRDVLENLEHQFDKKINVRGNGAYHVEQYELVAHRTEKNQVWSSEERRQLVRSRIQEHQQKLATEKRKQADAERKREQEERKKQQEAARAERRAQAEERRKQAEERRKQAEERRAQAEERRQAALAAGLEPDPEDIAILEAPVETEGQDASLNGDSGEEGGERGRRRRRRGRRGRGRRNRSPNAQPGSGGEGENSAHRAHSERQQQPGSDSYQEPGHAETESLSAEELAGSSVGGAAEGQSGEPGAGNDQKPGGDGRRRRRRGRRGGRRHRFKRRPGTGDSEQAAQGAENSSSGGASYERQPSPSTASFDGGGYRESVTPPAFAGPKGGRSGDSDNDGE